MKCPMCAGTGTRKQMSFVDPQQYVMRECTYCRNGEISTEEERLAAAKADGIADERAAVVAFLRAPAKYSMDLDDIIAAIERGEHRAAKGGE